MPKCTPSHVAYCFYFAENQEIMIVSMTLAGDPLSGFHHALLCNSVIVVKLSLSFT